MSEPDDHQLLAEFVRAKSEPAFAALVARYVNLVYSTALRFTGNTYHAEEITQAVFIILARKSETVSPRVVLSGWLYQVARLTSANFMKAEVRRQRREQEAYMQSVLNEPNDGWHEIAPLLDEAMGKLGKTDRDAVVLRYFENKSAAEIGTALQMNEEAARKRVNRALEKLHRYFHGRGISSTTAIIAGAISNHSVQAAPVGLAKAVTAVAMAKGAIAPASTLTLVKGILKLMAWQKMRTAVVIGAAVILAAGTATLLAQRSVQLNSRTNAVIPYKAMDVACQFTEGIDQAKLVVHTVVESNKKSVRPGDIHLTIQSAVKGPIPLKLGNKGQILNFPHDEALRRENPNIVSDQPKGTLGIGTWFYVPMPKELTFSYSVLANAVAEANKGEEAARVDGLAQAHSSARRIERVCLVFPQSSAGKARLQIESASGWKEYTADKWGKIILKIEDSLTAENPKIILSEKTSWVVPVIRDAK